MLYTELVITSSSHVDFGITEKYYLSDSHVQSLYEGIYSRLSNKMFDTNIILW